MPSLTFIISDKTLPGALVQQEIKKHGLKLSEWLIRKSSQARPSKRAIRGWTMNSSKVTEECARLSLNVARRIFI